MSNDSSLPADERTPYERFRDLARRVLDVPPEELQRRQTEWKAERSKKPKKNGPKGKHPQGR
jgi:hypothetical protein